MLGILCALISYKYNLIAEKLLKEQENYSNLATCKVQCQCAYSYKYGLIFADFAVLKTQTKVGWVVIMATTKPEIRKQVSKERFISYFSCP